MQVHSSILAATRPSGPRTVTHLPPNIRRVPSGATVHDCEAVPLHPYMSITFPLPPPLCRSSAQVPASADRIRWAGTVQIWPRLSAQGISVGRVPLRVVDRASDRHNPEAALASWPSVPVSHVSRGPALPASHVHSRTSWPR